MAKAGRSAEQAILSTVLELLPQVGYDRLSVDLVAQRAGSSKATIYRHWTGKADLVRGAIALRPIIEAPPPEPTGSLRGDLIALTRQACKSARDAYTLIVGLSPTVELHEEVVNAVRERTTAACQAHIQVTLQRGSGAAMLGPQECARLATLLYALIWDRMFTPHALLDDTFVEDTADTVLTPLLQAWSAMSATASD